MTAQADDTSPENTAGKQPGKKPEPGTRLATRPVARPSKAPHADALLSAACRLVDKDGLAGLALRPLADMLGVSVTVLSSHYGARADVVAAICDAARRQDGRYLDGWRATLAALPASAAMPPALAAGLAESMLEDMAAGQRALSLLYLELLHACTWDASLRPAFAAWDEDRRLFWQAFGEKAGLAPALIRCGWWHGYIAAELAYGMALDAVLPYRMLRRLCLQRLFAGGVARQPENLATEAAAPLAGGRAPPPGKAGMAHAGLAAPAADGALFAVLLGQLQQADGGLAASGAGAAAIPIPIHGFGPRPGPGPGLGGGRVPEWSTLAARACGIRLAAQGINGLTHRAIAADVGIAHTTLSYRFPTQRDLVVAGLESIADHIMAAVDAGSLTELQRLRTEGDGRKLDLARANFAVALGAARMPELAPYTANMRSRRGNNLSKVFEKAIPGTPGIDALCAHVISMGLTGLTSMEPPGAASDNTVASAFMAVAAWLRRVP